MKLPGSLSLLLSVANATYLVRDMTYPVVTVQNGTLVGHTNGHIENFMGIPYAQPPINHLRLRRPQPLKEQYGTLNLPEVARACFNQAQATINTTGFPNETVSYISSNLPGSPPRLQGEDCLTVNVQRPAGTSKDAKLPVAFWIYGGGFETGTTQIYDGSAIINKSIEMNQPVVYVAVNYRVSAFGFLGGRELHKEGSTNLGLRDQRLALQWVAENIAAFGGDPDRVTIFGESAGSMSAYAHLFANHGDNTYHGKPLFRGAIMDSGTILNTFSVDSIRAQSVYDQITASAGCANATDTLQCLRSAPIETFYDAVNQQPSFFGDHSNSLPFVFRPDPSDDLYPTTGAETTAKGEYVKVPVIIGNQEDEGTLFALSQRNLTTTKDLVQYFEKYFPNSTRDVVAGLVAVYSDDPADGSPFRTGTENQLYPQFKKLAAINGDYTFTLQRRRSLEALSKEVPTWSFLATYCHDLPYLGTLHTSDLGEIFRLSPLADVGNTINELHVNFFNTLNPNGEYGVGGVNWPQWDSETKQLLNISSDGLSLLTDNFRQEAYDYLVQHSKDLLF